MKESHTRREPQKTFEGTVRVFLAEGLFLPTGLLTAAFLSRRLGPENYGILTLAITIVVWTEWTVVAFFSRATIKLVGEAEDWRPVGSALMRWHLLLSGSSTLLLFLLAPSIAKQLREPVLSAYIRLLAIEIPIFGLAQYHQNILVGLGHFSERALASASRWIARLLFIVFFVWLGFGVIGAILGSIGATLADLAIGRYNVRPSLVLRSVFPAKAIWAQATPLFLFAISMRLYDKLGLVALKALGGSDTQAGVYSAAQNLTLAPGIVALSFAPILLSSLSRMVRTGKKQEAKQLGVHAIRAVIMLLPLAGMTAGAAAEIVDWIFGIQYRTAASLLSILIFGALAIVMLSVTAAILTAVDRPGLTFALAGPLVALSIIGYWVLIPQFGVEGAALVTTSCALVAAVAAVLMVRRVFGISPPGWTLARSTLVAALAYALSWAFPVHGFWILWKVLVIALIVVFAFFLLDEFSISEISMGRTMFRWPIWFGRAQA